MTGVLVIGKALTEVRKQIERLYSFAYDDGTVVETGGSASKKEVIVGFANIKTGVYSDGMRVATYSGFARSVSRK